jgi:SnoaL-like domain
MTTTATPDAIPESAALVAQVQELRDRHEVVDALLRFAAGQDHENRDLFLSAFAPDATLDFTQPAQRFGADVPVMPDRTTIAGILETLAPLDTTHTVTNPRVTLDGDRATLAALVEAQHVTKAEPYRHLLLKNTYEVDLSRGGDRWVIRRMVIRTVWHDGDASVLFGAAT